VNPPSTAKSVPVTNFDSSQGIRQHERWFGVAFPRLDATRNNHVHSNPPRRIGDRGVLRKLPDSGLSRLISDAVRSNIQAGISSCRPDASRDGGMLAILMRLFGSMVRMWARRVAEHPNLISDTHNGYDWRYVAYRDSNAASAAPKVVAAEFSHGLFDLCTCPRRIRRGLSVFQ
jgi:hypothetical protein